MFFNDWTGLLRILMVGIPAYAAIVILLRVTGKRTLSKMNAFDLIVTVALGSTLATVIMSRDVALAEGVLAFALLIFLQWAVAWGSAHSARFRQFIKAEPTLLFFEGKMLPEVMKEQRVAPEEIMAAARASGYQSLEQVKAVVLETDGSFNVIGTTSNAPPSAMSNVGKMPD
ncbi:DUF421 domain-containing protein [Telmatospirillum sp. J64-1]|uniref:DUF421 domain-containing protein n=1 Tax=Telmatospirillum sp. J64-1 TaxID=2502183 RepID=UPI00115EEE32|nr:YetF domain-containing protein [Telmatospirillum sp. J64-1]